MAAWLAGREEKGKLRFGKHPRKLQSGRGLHLLAFICMALACLEDLRHLRSLSLQVGKEVLVYGRGIPPAEMMLRIEAVDAEEALAIWLQVLRPKVKRVAYKYLNDQEAHQKKMF